MPTPLSFVQDELKDFIKQEIEKTKPALTNHLPTVLAELAGVYAVDTEQFWKQKHIGYFPYEIKPENKSFETSFQKNLEKLERAVTQNWYALSYAGPDAKNNPEIVKLAVAQDGRALEYAGADAKNNPEVVKIAVAENSSALEFASRRIQENPSLLFGTSNSSSASSSLTGSGFFQQRPNISNESPEEKDDKKPS